MLTLDDETLDYIAYFELYDYDSYSTLLRLEYVR